MEHEYSDDEWGFWEPDRTRRLPRLRGGEPTRALERVRPGSRHHGDGAAPTTTSPDAGHDAAHDAGAHHVFDEDLFDELGPADEFPGLDDLLGTAAVPVVTTTRRSWRQRLRRDERGRVDPFIARLGVVLLAGVVVLPVAVAANAGGAGTNGVVSTGTAVAATAPVATTAITPAAAAPATVEQAPVSAQPAAPAGATSPTSGTAADVATSAAQAQSARESLRRCASSYEVLPGDYWLGIADRADVDVDDLLAANGAATDTPLYPERTICLPAGATTPVPAPATTAATTAEKQATSADATGSTAAAAKAATTDAPATTKAATTAPATTPATKAPSAPATTTAPATTKAPATTAKPTTTTAAPTTTPPPRTYSREEVAQIIRDVWPDDLEDKAIAIATRESNLQPGVRNACCFGLFQIYFDVHDGWLAGMGVTQATQLYDPLVNAQAALTLYFRSGGWGPWGG